MIKLNNVMVATDFGDASIAALAYGREFARTFGAKLHVVHVVENPVLAAGPDAVGIDFARLQADLEARGERALEGMLTAEDHQQLQAVGVVRAGSPANEIVRYGKLINADIIILGTHGRGPMGHLLMGNVAEKVVRMAPCPVLTVRHPEHEFILPDALQAVEGGRR